MYSNPSKGQHAWNSQWRLYVRWRGRYYPRPFLSTEVFVLSFFPFDTSLILTPASPVGQANCCVVLLIPSCTPRPCWTLTWLWFCWHDESQELSLSSLKLLTLNSDFFERASKALVAVAAGCVSVSPKCRHRWTPSRKLWIFQDLSLYFSCSLVVL